MIHGCIGNDKTSPTAADLQQPLLMKQTDTYEGLRELPEFLGLSVQELGGKK